MLHANTISQNIYKATWDSSYLPERLCDGKQTITIVYTPY